jgi:hypothetical protein
MDVNAYVRWRTHDAGRRVGSLPGKALINSTAEEKMMQTVFPLAGNTARPSSASSQMIRAYPLHRGPLRVAEN